MQRALVGLVLVQALIIALLALSKGEDASSRDASRTSVQGQQPERESDARTGDEGNSPSNSQPEEKPDAHEREAEAIDYAVVYGRVRSSDGKPLRDRVWINLNRPDGERAAFAQVTKEGHYSLAGVAPGSYRLLASGQGYGERREILELRAGTRRHDITLQAGMVLRIRVETPEGKALSEALAEAKAPMMSAVIGVATEKPIRSLPLTTLRSHSFYGIGQFQPRMWSTGQQLPAAIAGKLMVTQEPPFLVHAVFMHMVLETKRVTGPIEEIKFVVSPEDILTRLAQVKVKVVDAQTGEPVQGARVMISDRQSGSGGLPTDENGEIVYPNVPPGIKEFQILAKDRERIHTFIRVPSGGATDAGTFRLGPMANLEVHFTGSDGKGVGVSAQVRNLDRMSFPQPLRHAMSHQSDTEGKMLVRWIGRGRYVIRAIHKDHAILSRVVTVTGNDAPLRFQLKKGTTVALEPSTKRTRDYFLTIRKDGVPYVTRDIRGPWTIRQVLEPGRYVMEIAANGEVIEERPLVVGTKPLVLPLELP